MVKCVKQSKKNLNAIIFLLTLSLKKKWLTLFLNYLQINLVCLMALWCLFPKQPLHVYCSKLTNIMNGCLKNKMFLDNIENTQITPCHKKNKGNKENYRPVSMLSSFWKVLERLIHRQLRSSKETKFSIFVTGFRKKHNMLYCGSL